ncbi:hypothetical protein HBI47_058680 [Parastagonospora nodorum]|nr:hypothetical protein HBI47_058680 [Parastagonospora nodorum]
MENKIRMDTQQLSNIHVSCPFRFNYQVLLHNTNMRPFYDASELPRSPLFSAKHRYQGLQNNCTLSPVSESASRPFTADIQADHKKEKEEAKATTKKDA